MNRAPAWRKGFRMIEQGEKTYRDSQKHSAVCCVADEPLLTADFVGCGWSSLRRKPGDSILLRDKARLASMSLNEFASDLDRAGYPESAVYVRRFMYETVEPVAGGQPQ